MSAVDANAIRVYVENDAVDDVTREDVIHWLSVLDELDCAKLQFDPQLCRPCYYVRFRRVRAAQQAVLYLNMVKLKNHTVRIYSHVFGNIAQHGSGAELVGDVGTRNGDQSHPNVTSGNDSTSSSTHILPYNDRLPTDICMDAALVPYLEQLNDGPSFPDSVALFESLRILQSRLNDCLNRIDDAQRVADRADVLLTEQLSVPSRVTDSLLGEGSRAEDAARNIVASAGFVNRVAIPFRAVSPVWIVSLITTLCGPLSHCTCATDELAEQLYVRVRFMWQDDRETFQRVVCASNEAGGGTEVPTCDAHPTRLRQLSATLRKYQWEECDAHEEQGVLSYPCKNRIDQLKCTATELLCST